VIVDFYGHEQGRPASRTEIYDEQSDDDKTYGSIYTVTDFLKIIANISVTFKFCLNKISQPNSSDLLVTVNHI
jgi:hypothetical protein